MDAKDVLIAELVDVVRRLKKCLADRARKVGDHGPGLYLTLDEEHAYAEANEVLIKATGSDE